MRYLGIDQPSKLVSRAVQSGPQSNQDIQESQNLAGAVRANLSQSIAQRDQILAQLRQSQQSQSSLSERDQCKNLRKRAKELNESPVPDSKDLFTLEQDYRQFVADNNAGDKPYLKPFLASMDAQIEELNVKKLLGSKITPKVIMEFHSIGDLGTNVMQIVGPGLNMENLTPKELSQASKNFSLMRETFTTQATRLFPELGSDFKQIDKQVSKAIDPQKAVFDFSFVKMPLDISASLFNVRSSSNIQDPSALGEDRSKTKNLMKEYYTHLANLDEDTKKRSVGASVAS
jgi:hypothetical protein